MVYGKPSGFISGGFINVESTYISTSPADQSLNQLKHEVEGYVFENKIESKPEVLVLNKDNIFSDVSNDNVFCGGVSITSDTVLNGLKKSSLNNLVDNSDVCDNDFEKPPVSQSSPSNVPSLASQPNSCSCSCERSKGDSMENKSDQCSTSYNNNKQICFNCGVGGHIARNCQNRMFVHFEFPRGENESRGMSLTRKSSRNHSRNGDWKDDRSRK